MKKLLILLFSLLISFNSYGEVKLDFSSSIFCNVSHKIQVRNGVYYLPNNEKPYSGNNLCTYSLNGQYFSQGEIKEGFMHGIWYYWRENGQQDKILLFQFGKLVFETKFSYYGSGQIQSEEIFKYGKLDGKRTWWHKNGQIKSKVDWKNGNKEGKLTWWDENGQITSERIYKDGECISGDCP